MKDWYEREMKLEKEMMATLNKLRKEKYMNDKMDINNHTTTNENSYIQNKEDIKDDIMVAGSKFGVRENINGGFTTVHENEEPESFYQESSYMEVSKIICISGSMRFWNEIQEISGRLTKLGFTVLTPYQVSFEKGDKIKAIKKRVRNTYKKKIDMCDILFVVNIDNYIGKDVKREIKYAKKKGKEVRFLEPTFRGKIITICGSAKFKDDIEEFAKSLRKRGNIVHTPETFNIKCFKGLSPRSVKFWHNVHYKKMMMSDEIIIFDKDSYIGLDTMREIQYAEIRGLKVIYYNRDLVPKANEMVKETYQAMLATPEHQYQNMKED